VGTLRTSVRQRKRKLKAQAYGRARAMGRRRSPSEWFNDHTIDPVIPGIVLVGATVIVWLSILGWDTTAAPDPEPRWEDHVQEVTEPEDDQFE
jgi:hypothetical protein